MEDLAGGPAANTFTALPQAPAEPEKPGQRGACPSAQKGGKQVEAVTLASKPGPMQRGSKPPPEKGGRDRSNVLPLYGFSSQWRAPRDLQPGPP